MTTIRKVIGAVLRALGMNTLADLVHPEGAGGAGPVLPPKSK